MSVQERTFPGGWGGGQGRAELYFRHLFSLSEDCEGSRAGARGIRLGAVLEVSIILDSLL